MWIQFHLVPPIVFLFRAFFYWGTIRRFSLNCTTVSHWRFHNNRRFNTHMWCFLIQTFTMFVFKCWILLKPVLWGMDDNLYFPVPSMNRLNRTEPASFSNCYVWLSLEILFFSFFNNILSLIIFNNNKSIYTKKWNYMYLHC
jgi:hypothetical protein